MNYCITNAGREREGGRVAVAGSRKRTNIDMSKADPRVRLLPKGAGIPKHNLGKELAARDLTVDAFAAIMRKTERTTVSKWISGARYMSDEDVVDASLRLGCTPMYLLDLTRARYPRNEGFPYTSSFCYDMVSSRIEDYENIRSNPDEVAMLLQPARTPSIVKNPDEAARAVREHELRKKFLRYLPPDDYAGTIDPETFLKTVLDGIMEDDGDHRDLDRISHLLLDRINDCRDNRADELLVHMCSSLLEK